LINAAVVDVSLNLSKSPTKISWCGWVTCTIFTTGMTLRDQGVRSGQVVAPMWEHTIVHSFTFDSAVRNCIFITW
jgi:hypothetical protein